MFCLVNWIIGVSGLDVFEISGVIVGGCLLVLVMVYFFVCDGIEWWIVLNVNVDLDVIEVEMYLVIVFDWFVGIEVCGVC